MSKLGELGGRLYRGEVSYDFVGRRNRWYAVSGVVLVLAAFGLFGRGLNLGIEFRGGAEFNVPLATATTADITKARETTAKVGETASSVTIVGGDTIRIQTESLSTEKSNTVNNALAKAFAPQVRVISVSPGVVDSTFVPGRGADFNDKAASTIPLKRIGKADDVAAVVQACATTMRYVTGTRIVVDGGRHL